MTTSPEIAFFGGGCFWCTEAVFNRLVGVISVESGYAGGHMKKPGYYDVTSGTTGHAEVIRVIFDPKRISYIQLLDIFFAFHDPTELNRQGADVGSQYRSIILYTNRAQREAAQKKITYLEKSGVFNDSIQTEIVRIDEFYTAEEYHQKYFERHSEALYCQVNIAPKINKLEKQFSHLLK